MCTGEVLIPPAAPLPQIWTDVANYYTARIASICQWLGVIAPERPYLTVSIPHVLMPCHSQMALGAELAGPFWGINCWSVMAGISLLLPSHFTCGSFTSYRWVHIPSLINSIFLSTLWSTHCSKVLYIHILLHFNFTHRVHSFRLSHTFFHSPHCPCVS